jgi:hypothetical protein
MNQETEPSPAGPTTIPDGQECKRCPGTYHEYSLCGGWCDIVHLQNELARERRRTASLVKAGDELAWECVTDDGTYIHGEDGEEIRGIKAAVEAWDTARAALAGPGGDETAGSGLDLK